MTPEETAQLRTALRNARAAVHALSDAWRARILGNKPAGEYAAQIALARAALKDARANLHRALHGP